MTYNESTDNRLAKRQTFSVEMMDHFICCLIFFGTDQISQFPSHSPAFEGINPSLLSSLCYKVLGTSSVKGLQGLGKGHPHVVGHRVQLGQVGKNDPADAHFFFGDEFSHVAP